MKSSAKFFVYGIILSAFIASFAQSASATQDVIRGDSYHNLVFNPPATFPDTRLVPGGILKFYANTMGAFGCSGTAQTPDTVTQFKIQFTKTASSVNWNSIFDTVEVYVDANNNEQYDAGDVTLVGTQSTPDSPGSQSSDYTINVTNPPLGRVLTTGTESYVIVVYTKNNLRLDDTAISVRIPNRGVTFVIDTAGPTLTLRPNPGQRDLFPDTRQLIFKVYNDSTVRVFQGNKFIHQDSRITGMSPFTLFQGVFQGETRTVGGDSLARFGVDMSGTAGPNVDSAWLVVGSSNIRVDLARTAGTNSWNAPAITTVPLALTGGADTFRVVVTADTPPLQSFVGCTISIDSVGTKFRRGNAAIIDSSGVVTFIRPRVAMTDSTLAAIVVHPDTRVTDSFILMSGTLQQDSLCSPILPYDTLARFAVRCSFINGFEFTHIDTVLLQINDTLYVSTATDPAFTGVDSAFHFNLAAAAGTFGNSLTYRVYMRTNNFATVNGRVRGYVTIDSVTTGYRQPGPSDTVLGSRVVTINRPRVTLTDSALAAINVHPDTLITDSFILMSGTLTQDTLLTPILGGDTLRAFDVRCSFSNGFEFTHIDTVQLQINDTVYISTGTNVAINGIDSTFRFNLAAAAGTFGQSLTYRVYMKTNNFAAKDGRVRGYVTIDSVIAVFRGAGPSDTVLGSRVVTINKPRVAVTDSTLANISAHPDTRVTDSFLLMAGTINTDTLLTPALQRDSITAFAFRLIFTGGMTSAHINDTTSQVILGNTVCSPVRTFGAAGGDTYRVFVPAGALLFAQNTYESFRIYIRTESSAPVNATVRAQLLVDSISTTFRDSGPSAEILGSRTVTMIKPRISIFDSALTPQSLSFHVDTRVQDSILIMAGTINRDTSLTPNLPYDTILGFSFRIIYGGNLNSSFLDDTSCVVLIGNTTCTPIRTGTDTYMVYPSLLNKTFSQTSYESYRVYLRFLSTAPRAGGSVQAQILTDSVTSVFQLAGPSVDVTANRVAFTTYPRLTISDSAMVSIVVHPDSRIHGNGDSLFVAQFNINEDTLLTPFLPYDTIAGIRVRLLGSSLNSLLDTFAHFDTVIMVLGSTAHVVANVTGGDSYLFVPNQTINGTTTIRVYVKIKNKIPAGCTLQVQIPISGVSSVFMDTSTVAVIGSRTDTFLKPRVALFESSFPGRFIHPDTRVHNDSFLLAQGSIVADTLGVLTYDTITQFKFRIRTGNTGDTTRIDTAILVLNGVSHVMSSTVGDSFNVYPTAQTVTGTTVYQIYVRTHQRARDTMQVVIDNDALLTVYRDSGPSDTFLHAHIDTIVKPRVAVLDSPAGARFVHPDSRSMDSFLLAAGNILADTLLTVQLRPDTLTLFSIRLVTSAGLPLSQIHETQSRIFIDSLAYTPVRVADSLYITPNQPFTDSFYYRVYIRLFNTAGINETIGFQIKADSIQTTFRDSGPASLVDTPAHDTIAKQNIVLLMTSLGAAVAHPDTRIHGVDTILVCSGVIQSDTFTGITYDSITRFGLRIGQGGVNVAGIDSVGIVINGETFTAINTFAGLDSWHVAPNKAITNSAQFQVVITFRDTTYLEAIGDTVFVTVPADSITTLYRDTGPKSDSHSSRTFTETKPNIRLDYTFMTTPGNDTINPVLAFSVPHVVLKDTFFIDSNFVKATGGIIRDTLTRIQVMFGGSAADSVYNAQVSFKIGGAWLTCTKVPGQFNMWLSPVLDSQVVDNDTLNVRINLADTTTTGTFLSCSIAIRGCSATFSSPGYSDSSGLFLVNADPIVLGMWTLPDSSIPIWQALASNPFMICSGIMFTNVGPVNMPAYDTLTNFGFSFDTIPTGMTSDSILQVSLRLLPSAAKPNGCTIALDSDGGNQRLWRFRTGVSDTTISETQPFQIFVRFGDTNANAIVAARNMRAILADNLAGGDSIFCRIPKDSVNTVFTSGLGGETSSTPATFGSAPHDSSWSKLHLIFADTTQIRQNFNYTDTQVNPDSRLAESFPVIFAGRINGVRARAIFTDSAAQQWYPPAGDSLIYFGIRVFSAIAGDPAADSVTAVTVLLSDSGRPIVLTRGTNSPAVPLGDRIWHWSASVDSPLLGANNSDTFIVIMTVMDTIPNGSRLRAEIFSDSIQTLYQADSRPAISMLGNRTITYQKPAISVQVTPLGDTTVTPFRQLNDSTVGMTGNFRVIYTPVDTIVAFGVQLSGLVHTRGESYQVRLVLESSTYIGFSETTLTLRNANSTLPTYGWNHLTSPADSRLRIDSGQAFTIRVVLLDTPINYIGESISMTIPTDSITLQFAQGTAGNLTCSRTIRFNYIDTITITDSALGDTSIHPDSRQRMAPFLAQVVTFQGQTSNRDTSGVLHPDTFRYADFQFTGSAMTGSSNTTETTIVAVWAQISTLTFTETRALTRRGLGVYRLTLDTVMPAANNSITCTITCHVFETAALGRTLRSEVMAAAYARAGDTGTAVETGARTVYTAGKLTSTVSGRTVTFVKPAFQIDVDNLGDTIVSPFAQQNDSTVVLSGRFSATNVDGGLNDTLTAFTVELRGGTAGFRGESIQLWLETDSGSAIDTNIRLTLVTPNAQTCTYTLPFQIRIDTGMRFFVRAKVSDVPQATDSALHLIGHTIFALIDSAASALVTGSGGGLHCSRVVRFNYTDTIIITDSALTDTTVHPDSRTLLNPFVAMVFKVQGQTSASGVADTFRFVSIKFSGSAVDTNTGYIIKAVWIQYDTTGQRVDSISLYRPNNPTLAALGHDTRAWAVNDTVWLGFFDTNVNWNNTVTCTVYVNIFDTAPLNTTLRAYIPADSTRTHLTNKKETATIAARTIFIGKTAFGVSTLFLNDSIVQLFRAQNDSTIIMQGSFAISHVPTDTVNFLQVGLTNKSGFGTPGVSDSLVVTFRRDSGTFYPSLDTQMIRVAGQDSWRLQADLPIDSGHKWSIWLTAYDTGVMLKADSSTTMLGAFTSMTIDSATAIFSAGSQNNLICTKVLRWAYLDTVLITNDDTSIVTVHPDSRLGQNPFVLYKGRVRGQTSRVGLVDRINRIGFRISGTSGTSLGDSIEVMNLVLSITDSTGAFTSGQDTFNVPRHGAFGAGTDTNAWLLRIDSALPYLGWMHCTVYVRIAESVALNTNMVLQMMPDSVNTYYSQDTPIDQPNQVFTATGHTISIGIPQSAVVIDTRASQAWVHPVLQTRQNPNYLRSRGQESNPIVVISGKIDGDSSALPTLQVTGDTLRVFKVTFIRPAAADSSILACTLTMAPNLAGAPLRTIVLSRLGSVATYETWGHLSIDTGFSALDGDTASDTFFVTIQVAETIAQNSTIEPQIWASSIKTKFRDTGTSLNQTVGSVFTFRRDSFFIYTEPRPSAYSSVLQRGESRAVMWFVPKSDLETGLITGLKIRLIGSAGKGGNIDSVTLWKDFNRNHEWESTFFSKNVAGQQLTDTLVGFFTQDAPGSELWTYTRYNPTAVTSEFTTDTLAQVGDATQLNSFQSDTSEYIVVVRIVPQDTLFTRIQCVIPANEVIGPYMESGPAGTVTYESFFVAAEDSIAPLTPLSFTVTAHAGSFEITWSPSPSGDTGMTNGQYVLYWDSGLGQFPTALLKTYGHVVGQLSYTISLPDSTAQLFTDSAYRFSLIAYDSAGNPSPASPVITAVFRSALSVPPLASALIISPNAGDRLWINPTAAAANKINFVSKLQDKTTASQVTSVEFGIRRLVDTGFGFTVFAVAKDSSYDAVGDVYYQGLLETTTAGLLRLGTTMDSYEVRAVAITASGRDTYATSISIILVTDTAIAQYMTVFGDSTYHSDSGSPSDTAFIQQECSTRSGEDILSIRTPTGAFDVILKFNFGSLRSDTARIIGTAQRDGMGDTLRAQIRAAGVEIPRYFADFTIVQNSNDTGLNAGATITINYIDANNDEIDDSSFVDMAKARIYTVGGDGKLERLQNLVRDPDLNTISGTVKHFSPFFVSSDTGITTAGLNSLLVGPNPFMPNDNNDQTGRAWVPGDATTGIIFKNLPTRVRIEIYTILGEKITEINKNDNNGAINWGVINDDGKPVTSGYYLYVVTDVATGQRVTGKVAVIR